MNIRSSSSSGTSSDTTREMIKSYINARLDLFTTAEQSLNLQANDEQG